MALTANVTKIGVALIQDKLYAITLNLKLLDGVTEVLSTDVVVRYRTGHAISEVTQKVITIMQAVIDRYKAEQVIYNHAQLDSAVVNIKNGLVL